MSELWLPYQLKESFRDIYQSGDRYFAEEKFEHWCNLIPEGLAPFLVVKETVRNWYNEIFNYFDYPYTNAITESINKLIKSIEKAGRGYTFDVIRAKILYSTKATRMPVYKAKPNRMNCYGYVSLITFEDDKELVCGTMSDCDLNFKQSTFVGERTCLNGVINTLFVSGLLFKRSRRLSHADNCILILRQVFRQQ